MGNTISEAAIVAALGRQMTRAVEKQAVAAGNLANLDTPGYRTKEIKFSDILSTELAAGTITATHEDHLGATAGSDTGVEGEAAGLAARRDGNNVQLDRELLSMTRAGGEFNAAQTMLAAKFRLVRYAINEGR